MHSHDVAEALAEKGIAVRAGKHCAHPLFYKV
ncbi:MAG: aminotransferase class V-fold PLP-dependent enzyme [Candidatus Peribacteria bacterium]|nr:aminotransferase class V-fold PLP-dependent enzyme [Candidatus Peribacteria bacterium]